MRGDYSQVNQLERALRGAPARVTRQVLSVTKKGALNVKRDAARTVRATFRGVYSGHARIYPKSITYDVTTIPGGGVVAVIGPDKDLPQGALGNLLEYGSSNNPPHPHLGPAVERERPEYMRQLGLAGVRAMFPTRSAGSGS